MIPGVNPELMAFVVKGKLTEIIKGEIPDGFKLISKEGNKITLAPSENFKTDGIVVNKLYVSISYNDHEIVVTNESI